MIINRGKWFLFTGSDIHDSNYGITFGCGPMKPDGIHNAWRNIWRISVRWPIVLQWHRRGG